MYQFNLTLYLLLTEKNIQLISKKYLSNDNSSNY